MLKAEFGMRLKRLVAVTLCEASQLPGLRELRLRGVTCDVESLAAIGSMTELESLDLARCSPDLPCPMPRSPLSIEQLPLGELTNLRTLDLSCLDSELNDCVACLCGLVNLVQLNLSGRVIPSSSLARLSALTGLQTLNLAGRWLARGYMVGRDLAPLTTLTGLRELVLDTCALPSLDPLGQLSALTELSLYATRLGAPNYCVGLRLEDLGPLSRLGDLRVLDVFEISPEEEADLRRLLPACKIETGRR